MRMKFSWWIWIEEKPSSSPLSWSPYALADAAEAVCGLILFFLSFFLLCFSFSVCMFVSLYVCNGCGWMVG